MTTMVWPLLFKSLKISKTWLPVFESKFPVGSSANRMEGEFTNALAIATLCCSPPDSSVGLCVSRLVRPTLSNTSSALISLSDCFTEAYFSGRATFSSAELLGRSWNF
ncbi:MAG: hypothetical protein CM1200mP12_20770 [Gammaproteobacteria bacterium]|nr:MAG: hypothetical protein CM1200mP12_20770 [Gammaproteobacteria bacterium]